MARNMLFKRRKTFYFRLWIPSDIQKIFKCTEFIRSLKTEDRKAAKLAGNTLLCEAEKLFFLVRSGMLSSEQIDIMIERFKKRTLDHYSEARREYGPIVYLPKDLQESMCDAPADDIMEQAELYHGKLKRKIAADIQTNNHSDVRAIAEDLLRESNIDEPPASAKFRYFCEYLLKAQWEISNTIAQRMSGDTRSPYDGKFEVSKPTLADLWAAYKDFKITTKKWSTIKTQKKYEGYYQDAVECIGNRALDSYDRESGTAFLKHLSGNSSTTQTAKIEFLSSLFKWAQKDDKWGVRGNPFQQMQVATIEGAADTKLPYTMKDLVCLLTGLLTVRKIVEPHRFWIPLIALYSGMRQNEICQLCTEDVVQIGNHWAIQIKHNPAKQQKIKNKRNRTCPVHPMLKHLGFLDFVAEQKKKSHDRLFHTLTWSEGKDWTGKIRTWWNETFQKTYVEDLNGKSFHSLRKNFIDCFKQNKVYENASDRQIVQSMVGHEIADVTSDHYEESYGAAAQYKVLTKLDYGFPVELIQQLKDKKY